MVVVVLLTGMSGTGKSTALAGLARLGFETIDTDDAGWIDRWAASRSGVRIESLRRLNARGTDRSCWSEPWRTKVGGAHRFAAVVLLTAPLDVLMRRLHERPPGEFGSTEADRAKVARDAAEVEPLLRATASHVLDTSADREAVVAALASIIESTR